LPLVVKTEHARKLVNQNHFNFNDNAKNGKRIKIINQRIKNMEQIKMEVETLQWRRFLILKKGA
jgi:hypothetical protein